MFSLPVANLKAEVVRILKLENVIKMLFNLLITLSSLNSAVVLDPLVVLFCSGSTQHSELLNIYEISALNFA